MDPAGQCVSARVLFLKTIGLLITRRIVVFLQKTLLLRKFLKNTSYFG